LLLIAQKTRAELIAEARRGYIGILWWILEPLFYMSVFYIVFVVLFKRGGEDKVAFLLTGLVVWKWFAATIPQCANCISLNEGLVRQVYVPKFIFPAIVLATNTVKFLIVLTLLVLFLVFTGRPPNITWLSLPVLIGSQMLLMFSVGCFMAAIVPFFPDLKLIVDNGLLLVFFLSGVFFDIGNAPARLKVYLGLNPMVGTIQGYRTVLLHAAWPDWMQLFAISSFSFFLLVVGLTLLKRYDRIYAKIM